MAYDKVIDSAKLDGALTSTANAIRGKTGATAKIAWNESSGFSSAISAIESGGSKVATGTFTASGSSDTTTISGLGFQPTKVIVWLVELPSDEAQQQEDAGWQLPLCISYGFTENGIASNTYELDAGHEWYDEEDPDTGEAYEYAYTAIRRPIGSHKITPTSNGFTLRDVYRRMGSFRYAYAAIG